MTIKVKIKETGKFDIVERVIVGGYPYFIDEVEFLPEEEPKRAEYLTINRYKKLNVCSICLKQMDEQYESVKKCLPNLNKIEPLSEIGFEDFYNVTSINAALISCINMLIDKQTEIIDTINEMRR